MQVLENNKADFGINFVENKKILNSISIIRSKSLKNEITGYITRFLKHEMLDKKKQDERLAKQTKLDEETSENLDSNASEVKTPTPFDVPQTEEKTQEIPENASE